MKETIIQAINDRRYIQFTYGGHLRVAQPATIGMLNTGVDAVRCYQTEGGHNTAGHKWDLCHLSQISGLEVLSEHFVENPEGYKKGDKAMRTIYAEL